MADLYGLLIRVLITLWCYFIFIMGCIIWGGLGIPLTLLLSHFWPSLRDRFNDGTQRILGAFPSSSSRSTGAGDPPPIDRSCW